MPAAPVCHPTRHRRLSKGLGVCLALSLALAGAAASAVLAASVNVRTHRISRASPFSPSAPCAQANPGFSPGFAQESSVAVNPRNPRKILVSWIQDGQATDVVMASRNGGRTFSRILVPGLSACTGGPFEVASDPGVDFSADGRQAWFSAIVVDIEDEPSTCPSEPEGEGATTSMYAYPSTTVSLGRRRT
jgi:hypothetical protein